ncbi:MAG: hypothetical protein RIQ93_1428 [Verrucomicrobiota bacterium]|jgi:glucose/arabinose dehydrogenase
MRERAFAVGLALLISAGSGCYSMRPSSGSGQTAGAGEPRLDPAAVVVPAGYHVELVAERLNFPVGVALDDQGGIFVVESGYSYGEVFAEPRLLQIRNGGQTVVASGGRGGPWTGVALHEGEFIIADGNVLQGGRILRVNRTGQISELVTNLPSFGDHHTNGPVVGPDGWIYFSQGTATNSGVVGEDNAKFGWLKRRPEFHDVPGQDITLTGENFPSADAVGANAGRGVQTGAFLPFGVASQPGQTIRGAVRASGAVLRVRPAGGEPELVAWGFRNPFGLGFAPDGILYAADNGYDDRGSRRVWGAPDIFWRVEPGLWYGWPDYVAGVPITDPQFRGPGRKPLRFLLANHPNVPPAPKAKFAVHASADGFDFSRNPAFGFAGQPFVAIFGDQAPDTGKTLAPIGGRVVRVDLATGVIMDFAVNRAPREGAGSKVGVGGLERPVAARFDPKGEALYIVDFGVMQMSAKGSEPKQHTGALWRIRRAP